MPVEATFADAEPEIEPNSADDRTDTLAAPPFSRPAAAMAMFMKPWPASPAFRMAPKMTKTATTETETPVSLPHSPPSVMTSVPRKLLKGRPMPELARNVASEKTREEQEGNQRQPADAARHFQRQQDQPDTDGDLPASGDEAVLVDSAVRSCDKAAEQRADNGEAEPQPTPCGACAAKTNTHGSASAMWSGRETRLGTSPEKMSQIWNVIEAAPRPTQIQR